MTARQLRKAAKELAAKGGRSAKGTAKRRPRAHYVRAGKLSVKARLQAVLGRAYNDPRRSVKMALRKWHSGKADWSEVRKAMANDHPPYNY